MATKRNTDLSSPQVQQMVREARAAALRQSPVPANSTPRHLPIPKHDVQDPRDILKTMSTEEITALVKTCNDELRMRGELSVPDTAALLREWKRLHLRDGGSNDNGTR